MSKNDQTSRNSPAGRCSATALVCALVTVASTAGRLQSQSSSNLLTSRAELIAAADRAEKAAGTSSGAVRARNQLIVASLHQRLLNGDFLVGDRIVLAYVSDSSHTDTLIVRTGPTLELPAKSTVSLSGVLRSELSAIVEAEVLKYVKAVQIEVTPLTRVGVLGEVAHPGYFALRSDIPLADAIMIAGGPTGNADIGRAVVRRGNAEFRSAEETRQAISTGVTLDQFGLNAGDELIIARKRDLLASSILPLVGALASIAAIFVALNR